MISQLVASELLRQNKEDEEVSTLTRAQILEDSPAADAIEAESKKAHTALFGGLSCRVKVAGLDRKDLNGRQGTLRAWDADQGKFLVGLDTKKGADSDVHLFLPENLEATSAPRPGKGDKKLTEGYRVDISVCFSESASVGCQFTVDKSMVASLRFATLRSAKSIDDELEAFSLARDESDRERRVQEEKERKQFEKECRQDEADRKRRQKQKAKAKAEANRQKAQRRAKWQKTRDDAFAAKMEAQRLKAERSRVEGAMREMQRMMAKAKMRHKFVHCMFHAAEEGENPRDYLDEFVERYEEEFDYEFDSDDEDFFEDMLGELEEHEREHKKRMKEKMREMDGEMAELLGECQLVPCYCLKLKYYLTSVPTHRS